MNVWDVVIGVICAVLAAAVMAAGAVIWFGGAWLILQWVFA